MLCLTLCQPVYMARGWESKEVEMQIESAQERHERANKSTPTPAEIALERERESIELSRSRVLQDMASASNPRYREMLQRSLDFLDAKLAKLAAPADKQADGQSAGR
jgi:hypothetical protein